jgi:hypothetical protein
MGEWCADQFGYTGHADGAVVVEFEGLAGVAASALRLRWVAEEMVQEGY